MKSDRKYRIDMASKDLDSFLRLEDRAGKQLAMDDDSGGNLNARIVYVPDKPGNYRIIATCVPEKSRSGKYTLTVLDLGPPTPEDRLLIRAKGIEGVSKEEKTNIATEFAKYIAAKPKATGDDAMLAMQVAGEVEQTDPNLAARVYTGAARSLSKSDNPQLARMSKLFEGSARRVELPGKVMEIRGVTMEGKPFDWKSYRGKVVLVDFWATWCGPCLAELPNVKKLYAKYHDRGFDVVGISLDRSKEAVTKFQEKEKLPWISLFDADEGNSLAEYYGVLFIPLPILLDREGRVLSMSARGQELAGLLEKHLGSRKADK
jgi:thiol-disulfide isomerase/thioredoxin